MKLTGNDRALDRVRKCGYVQGFVYFANVKGTDIVKIGFTSLPRIRASTLKAYMRIKYGKELDCFRFLPAKRIMETRLHRVFRNDLVPRSELKSPELGGMTVDFYFSSERLSRFLAKKELLKLSDFPFRHNEAVAKRWAQHNSDKARAKATA